MRRTDSGLTPPLATNYEPINFKTMKQKTYVVTITETLARDIVIEATSKREAEKIVRDKYMSCRIILSDEDYCSNEIKARDYYED